MSARPDRARPADLGARLLSLPGQIVERTAEALGRNIASAAAPVPTMDLAVDGTGVPGRQSATTEELNPQGRPTLDPDPSAFARRVRREAERRGFTVARRRMILGDGAAWIRRVASEDSPDTIRIVDSWHAKEHFRQVVEAPFREAPAALEAWARARCDDLE